tara:strand:+ start:696 stop:1697 length:1002 start_codon:yes stop_codon:yes gene_type:complete
MNLHEIKNKLFDKITLSFEETTFLFDLIMKGQVEEIDLSSILIALKIKNEEINEIHGAAKIMIENSLKISSPINTIDTCGTGGDKSGTLNISTSAAIVAASAGAKVAKHGNRSISSKSGSADMLENLNFKISSKKDELEKSLNEKNFCFLFAQYHHSAMKHVAKVRKQLGTRTIFNMLGPLTNPASAKRQLLGVFEKRLVRIHCEVLKKLGSSNALVVHGFDGLDEISLTSPTYISELKNDNINDFIFDPKDYGYDYIKIEEIAGNDPAYNAKAFIELLDAPNNSFQKIVELNAGASLYLSGLCNNIKDGIELAKNTINSKKTKNFFDKLVDN